jgi:hypothetical protein
MKKLTKRLQGIESKAKSSRISQPKKSLKYITLEDLENMSLDDLHDSCMDFVRGRPMSNILEYADPICAKKILSEGETDSFMSDLVDEKPEHPDSQFIQIQNPESDEWCLIDREKARIIKNQKLKFSNVPMITI